MGGKKLFGCMMILALFLAACGPEKPEPMPTAEIILPTSTPMPTPTPACNVTSDLMPEWTTVLCDEFEDNRNGWYEGDEEDELSIVDIAVQDGQYVMNVTGKNVSGYQAGVIQWFDMGNGKNFMVSIDGLIESKNRGVTWGFNFWGNDNNFYSFAIGKEGQYYMNMVKDGDWYYLIKTKTNKAIKWDEVNNLSIVVEGNKFTFYANGTRIETYESDEALGDEVSLFISVDEGAKATYYFDNALLRVGD